MYYPALTERLCCCCCLLLLVRSSKRALIWWYSTLCPCLSSLFLLLCSEFALSMAMSAPYWSGGASDSALPWHGLAATGVARAVDEADAPPPDPDVDPEADD